MDEFNFDIDSKSKLEEMIDDLNRVNYEIARAKDFKEKLERAIIETIGRARFIENEGKFIMTDITYEGSDTHKIGQYKVTIKTDYIYKIKKSEYEILKNLFRSDMDPIRTKIDYSINKNVYRDVIIYGSNHDKQLLNQILTLEGAKPSVTIKANS